MVAFLASMLVSPLVLEVDAPREVFEGEPIPVTASLVNRSQKPVVIVRPHAGNRSLGMSVNSDLIRGDRVVPAADAGMNGLKSSIVPWAYGQGAFQTLMPGEGIKIEDVRYREEFTGTLPTRKDERSAVPRTALKPGEYTVHIAYGFDRSGKPRLTEDARDLYRSAWAGFLDLRRSVTVRPRP